MTPTSTSDATNASRPTVAVIGASADGSKFGAKSVRAHRARGYDVYPVNPKGGSIDGLTVYRNLAEAPVERFTRVSMYVPPRVGLQLVDEIARKGCDEFWLNPGSESDELIAKARAAGLNVIIACSIVALGERPEAH